MSDNQERRLNRFDSADDAQNLASDPGYSAWVGASAGTGKTKVLSDRVLRLLLPRKNGQTGTLAHRLVCLTYTKAAANEMAVRIIKILGSWAVMDVDNDNPKKSLRANLKNLLGYSPGHEHLDSARRLFAEVIDSSGGLQIMTIHAFCQSVLGRFPIEAGVSPDFALMDEGRSREVMQQAVLQMINKAQDDEHRGSALADAYYNLCISLSSDAFFAQIAGVSKERNQVARIFEKYKSVESFYVSLCEFYGIAPWQSEIGLIEDFCKEGAFDREGLREVAVILLKEKGKTAIERGGFIEKWLAACSNNKRVEGFSSYRKAFLTAKDTIHQKAFPPKGVEKKYPYVRDVLQKEARRIVKLIDNMKSVRSADMTRDMFFVAQEVLKNYERLKQREGCLDYDDLISRTMQLFTGCTEAFNKFDEKIRTLALPWVLYKLDQGIDHVLIDEAQDTNPEQWRIIEALGDDFFSGDGARPDLVRTYFTVGDIKQSIYGFQRAAPDEFKRMEGVFDNKIKNSGQVNNIVPLDTSFRSTESVLRVVDKVFEDKYSQEALGERDINHRVYRKGQEGRVELWPVFDGKKKEKKITWEPPVQVKDHDTGVEVMARFIAEKIQNWTDSKEILSSHNRAIEPKDIMILVRSRTGIVEHLIRALKARGIPVSGADRMIVSDQLAVQDLLSFARFCLFPEDDLTLAEVLKSPLIGFDEDDLFALSYARKGTLWQELCNPDWNRLEGLGERVLIPDEGKISDVRHYLRKMIGRICVLGSYEFFSIILGGPCPADAVSGMRAMCKRLGEEVFDPIEELLNTAIEFSYSNTDHVQKFVDEQERMRKEIKREMEEAGNKVRIMTVHGSKGLQSPIVILPDTMQKKKQNNRDGVLWPAKTGLDVPLFAPNVNAMPEVYASFANERLKAEKEEEQRLLYVAMTRAADRLYVTGYNRSSVVQKEGWYEKIKCAMQKDNRVRILNIPEGEVLRIDNVQSAKPDRDENEKIKQQGEADFKPWIFIDPDPEPVPSRPLMPSRPSLQYDKEDRSISPLLHMQNKRFLRGNVTHKLLEFLPDYLPERYEDISRFFLERNAAELSVEERNDIVKEVCAILLHPEYRDFFRRGSMAEVSVSGLMSDNNVVSGQIDRLVIGESDIWIVDYKTNRPSPREEGNIPNIYREQLRAYRDVIQKIYPAHKIHCALLWTDIPRLMRISL